MRFFSKSTSPLDPSQKTLDENQPQGAENKSNFIAFWSFYGFLFLILLFILAPMTEVGFTSDDIHNSLVQGIINRDHESSWELGLRIWKSWLPNGRFFLSFLYIYKLWELTRELWVNKLVFLSSAILCFYLFQQFVSLLMGSRWWGGIAAITAAALVQFRCMHDPLLGQFLFLPLVGIGLFSTLIFLWLFLDGRGWGYFILAFIFHLFSLLTYEISYTFILIHMALIFFYRGENTFRRKKFAARAFIIPLVLCLIATAFLKGPSLFSNDLNNAYSPNWSLAKIGITWICQTIGVVPLAYYHYDVHNVFANVSLSDLLFFRLLPVAFCSYIAFVIIISRWGKMAVNAATSTAGKSKKISARAIFLISALLILLPGSLISLSPRYQVWVSKGYSYLPIFISYFGLALLIVCLMYVLLCTAPILSKIRYRCLLFVFFAVALAGIIQLHRSANAFVLDSYNQSSDISCRNILNKALRNGLFDEVEVGAKIYTKASVGGDIDLYLHMMLPDKKLNIQSSIAKADVGAQTKDFRNDPAYSLKIFSLGTTSYAVCLSKLSRVELMNEVPERLFAKHLRVFFGFTKYEGLLQNYALKALAEDASPYTFRPNPTAFVSQGDRWAIYHWPTQSLAVETLLFDMSTSKSLNVEQKTPLFYAQDAFLLESSPLDKVHRNHSDQSLEGYTLDCTLPEKELTLELVFQSPKEQPSLGVIIGNHPGKALPCSGFVIQGIANGFSFGYGNGSDWCPSINFKLQAEQWNYLVLICKPNLQQLYLNGALVGETTNPDMPAKSDSSFVYGNWETGERPFYGAIKEVRLSEEIISTQAIARNYKSLLEKAWFTALFYGKEDFLLPSSSSDKAHLNHEKQPLTQEGYTLHCPLPEKELSLELVFQSPKSQPDLGVIIGNHPGRALPYSGFVIQGAGDAFSFCYGNGSTWFPAIDFKLAPEQWYYLVLNCKPNLQQLYLNGVLVAQSANPDMPAKSDSSFVYGNWELQNRPFFGVIKELRLSEEIITAQSVDKNYKSLMAKTWFSATQGSVKEKE